MNFKYINNTEKKYAGKGKIGKRWLRIPVNDTRHEDTYESIVLDIQDAVIRLYGNPPADVEAFDLIDNLNKNGWTISKISLVNLEDGSPYSELLPEYSNLFSSTVSTYMQENISSSTKDPEKKKEIELRKLRRKTLLNGSDDFLDKVGLGISFNDFRTRRNDIKMSR